MSPVAPERRTFAASLDCNYLVTPPPAGVAEPLLAVALHGYGMDAQTMHRLSLPVVSHRAALVSLEAPNQFYLGHPSETAAIGFNWGTRSHWGASIRLHQEMVRNALREAQTWLAIPRERCLLLGFSQPVSMNYRFLAAHPHEVRGAIAICGGIPGDWERDRAPLLESAILHIARSEDEYYSVTRATTFETKLTAAARDFEFHMLPGKHRFPSQARSIVNAWMDRVWGKPTPRSEQS
ncbi:MAG: hypothetical protein U0Q16_14755 [Bryobacteraceae bacterium]